MNVQAEPPFTIVDIDTRNMVSHCGSYTVDEGGDGHELLPPPPVPLRLPPVLTPLSRMLVTKPGA